MIKKIPNKLIILGGGTSIRAGIKKGLWDKIRGQWVIGLNYSYKFFLNSTFHCWVDDVFYIKQNKELSKLPLLIGQDKDTVRKKELSNTIFLPSQIRYKRNLSGGVYKTCLAGLWGLSLGIYLLDIGEIYLLGYDFGELRKKDFAKFMPNRRDLNNIMIKDKKGQPMTHFYQGKLYHRGIGRISFYNDKERIKNTFAVYKNEKKVKIYNVSLPSKLDTFPKISYDTFFTKLDGKQYDQEFIREYTKKRIKEIK